MTKAIVPHTFRSTGIVDVEHINANLERIARDVNANLAQRYFYFDVVYRIDGMTDTGGVGTRQLPILLTPSTRGSVLFDGADMRIVCTGGATWTLTFTSFSGVAAISCATGKTAATSTPATMTAGVNYVATLSGSAASTITSGTITMRFRVDRGATGWRSSAHTPVTPTQLDATSSTAGSVLDTALTTIETAVTADANNSKKPSAVVIYHRAIAAGTINFRLPACNRSGLVFKAFTSCDVGESITVTVEGTSDTVNGTGTSALAVGTETSWSFAGTSATTSGDDIDGTIVAAGGTVETAGVMIWFE